MQAEARECSAREARAHFADVVNDAIQGQITYITSHGRRVAAVVPLSEIRRPAEPYETAGPVKP